MINIETKVCETTASPTAVSYSGAIVSLSSMAQGLDYANNRVGDSVKLQNITLRVKLQINAAATRTGMRCILFRDLDGYGTAPSVSDILNSSGNSISLLYPKNYLNSDRFSILADDLVSMSITNDQMVLLEYDITHEGHVKYLGTTATNSSNGKGSIYVLFISDEPTLTPTYAFHSRVYFTDD